MASADARSRSLSRPFGPLLRLAPLRLGPLRRGTLRRGPLRAGRPRPAPLRVARLAVGAAAALSVAAAVAPAVAGASVTIGPEEIEVQGAGAGAQITRAPFQISFTNSNGQKVLSELPAREGGTLTLPSSGPSLSAEPTGPALYAPLSFLVGSEQPSTFTESSYVGDLQSVEESGTEYSAREVTSASAVGEGVQLTLSTTDPSGRKLLVTVAPDGDGAISVSARPSDPTGVAAMADSFSSTPTEAFHGFGGRHNALDQRGQDFYNWVDQENIGTGPQEAEGETTLTPDGPQAAYYMQSSFVSNQGYGFLLNRNELSRWRMDSDSPEAWQTQVAAPVIDYVVTPGSLTQALGTLSSITGRQRVPPSWALEPMFDRGVETPTETAKHYEQQVQSDIKRIELYKLPVSAYRIEGWQFFSKSSLEAVFAQLHEHNIHPLVYFKPFVGEEDIGTENPQEFTTAVQDGYVATNSSGQPYIFNSNYGEPGAMIDFTNPAAVQWWKGRIEAALEMGADGFMIDFGEQVEPGMRFADGETGAQMHNLYPVLYQRATREAVEAFEASHPGRQIFFYARSGYSGTPGSAAWVNGNFPGDETTDWSQSSGLASQTRDMLNRAIGGAFGFGTDIGGYWDLAKEPDTRELFLRWSAWAALSPVFRLHGALIGGVHTPWSFHEGTPKLYRQFSELHKAAAPLIATLWQQADETGVPVTRPLYLEYPEDPQAQTQDQEWLLGPDVLVAPVVTKGATSRSVYFPSGCWRSPASGQEVTGPTSATVQAEVSELPFFFRCGTVPFTPPKAFAGALEGKKGKK